AGVPAGREAVDVGRVAAHEPGALAGPLLQLVGVDAFGHEHGALCLAPEGVVADATVAAYHPVAGDQPWGGTASERRAHGPHCARPSDLPSHPGIGADLSCRDRAGDLQHIPFEVAQTPQVETGPVEDPGRQCLDAVDGPPVPGEVAGLEGGL